MSLGTARAALRTDGVLHSGRLMGRLTERHKLGLLTLVLVAVAVACSGGEPARQDTSTPRDWEAVVSSARGQTLDLYMWGQFAVLRGIMELWHR